MVFELNNYYSNSDTWTVLYSEIVYMRTFLTKIGELPKKQQVLYLIDELEKLKEDNKTEEILISIYFLLLEFKEVYNADEPKHLQFIVIQDCCKDLTSNFFMKTLLNEMRVLKGKVENLSKMTKSGKNKASAMRIEDGESTLPGKEINN